MKFCINYIVLFFILFSTISHSQLSNTVVKATISLEEVNGTIKVTGVAENLSKTLQSLSYKLTVIKNNSKSNNQSNNAQEGLFTLDPGQIKNLSQTQINLGNDDEIIVLLLFYDENQMLIGKDRVVLNNEKKKVSTKPADGFEFKGVIADETKTKIGKDFYDLYYYKYNDNNINSEKIVTISEEFSFGRNTKIIISIENNLVYEFLARPDEEYMDYMVQNSVYQTYLYLKEIESQSKYFTQY